ncbi:ribonuclease H-like domain, reverse transcriptase, RNA-dependent DNA polymerase [Tanacetum coccineum]
MMFNSPCLTDKKELIHHEGTALASFNSLLKTNDFASSDSNVKSSEPKSNDSTSCASTSSVSTSESEAEIESNVGTPIQEPIIVQDLPSFSCNSSDKNENTSKTSCNKNGYFNKKAGHFRKNASSVSKLCFVCGSSTHLIKDCDFYEKQMANKTVGNGVGPVHRRNNVNHPNQFVPQTVLLRTGKVNIPPVSPQPVLTGKPKVPAPVPTGSKIGLFQFLLIEDILHQWATAVKPSAGNSFIQMLKDEGISDSWCSRSNDSLRGNLACLVAKASVDESVKWHRRMGIATQASYKANTAGEAPFLILCNCFIWGPHLVLHQSEALTNKNYCLVITEDYSRDKEGLSNARTPQQNGVAERKNRTLIEASRYYFADSKVTYYVLDCEAGLGHERYLTSIYLTDTLEGKNVKKLTHMQEHEKLQLTLAALCNTRKQGSINTPGGICFYQMECIRFAFFMEELMRNYMMITGVGWFVGVEAEELVGILLGHLGGAPLCAAGRPSCPLASRQKHPGLEIIAHSFGMTLLLRNVIVPPSTGNFNIPLKCSASPIFTSRDIWPIGQMVSPLNPMSDVVAGIIWLLIYGRSLMKQCSYRTSEDAPPSTYIRCTKYPPILASMIIGPSVPSFSPKDGKEIIVSGEKL